MTNFKIGKDFLIDGKPFKIISGAVHYFRIPVSQWENTLYNLKALGANTVETYVPWNFHEKIENKFDFYGMRDVVNFIKLAQKVGLYVILRPSAYICAEWEFGGLPAWLLKYKDIKLRSTDNIFMSKVEKYYSVLLPMLVPLQISKGGPIIMMQVENEFGSYSMDKDYLHQTKTMMSHFGIDVPFFTSDGAWQEALDAGSLIEENVLVTGNFGSRSKENVEELSNFMKLHGKEWPIMCMEYWDGWFDKWNHPVVKRDPQELATDVKEMLKMGSINLYMFHGGTNFGFYNGCSARYDGNSPQVTSYDYGALLSEDGNPTEKYYLIQKAIKEVCPDVIQSSPRIKKLKKYPSISITESVSLFNIKSIISEKIETKLPQSMEDLDSYYGYVLYEFETKNYGHKNNLRLIEADDRAQVYNDGEYVTTQYLDEIGKDISIKGNKEFIKIDCLIENVGRVNYGFKLNHPSQSKGIRNGAMVDLHFHQGYKQYVLDFSDHQIDKIDFSLGKNTKQPSFYRGHFYIEECFDTYINCSEFGKGVIIVNGNNLGRYWSHGPYHSLFCPKDFLVKGVNEIIIFETEGMDITKIQFSEGPNIDD